jgi:hypothetical protein
MKRIVGHLIIAAMLVAAGAPAIAQEAQTAPAPQPAQKPAEPERVTPPDRAVVPLSNPAKPAKVEASIQRGSITVRGYDGKEVIAEARIREKPLAESRLNSPYFTEIQKETLARIQKDVEKIGKDREKLAQALAQETYSLNSLAAPAPLAPGQEGKKERSHEGMRLITAALTGLSVTEDNNTVTVKTGSWKYAVDLTIQVPYATSLDLSSSTDGNITVEGVNGEIEVKGMNGFVVLRNVSGNAVVHTMSGDIEATLAKVSADKPLSFSNMNGDIDITLPADIRATVRMKSQMGNIYSDFDVALKQAPPNAEEVGPGENGKYYKISFDKGIYGTINGGGQEITLTTFNGDIFIRKKK